jgi:hypothetical protein
MSDGGALKRRHSVQRQHRSEEAGMEDDEYVGGHAGGVGFYKDALRWHDEGGPSLHMHKQQQQQQRAAEAMWRPADSQSKSPAHHV